MKIGDFEATLMHARVGDTTVVLWRVAELAPHVDRAALLAADEAPEPPYWAHLWSGAVVLAAAMPRGARRLLADAGRIDTRAFYAELDGAGLAWRAREEPVREEGLPLTVKLVEVAPRC